MDVIQQLHSAAQRPCCTLLHVSMLGVKSKWVFFLSFQTSHFKYYIDGQTRSSSLKKSKSQITRYKAFFFPKLGTATCAARSVTGKMSVCLVLVAGFTAPCFTLAH